MYGGNQMPVYDVRNQMGAAPPQQYGALGPGNYTGFQVPMHTTNPYIPNTRNPATLPCRTFNATGNCRYGMACKFMHGTHPSTPPSIVGPNNPPVPHTQFANTVYTNGPNASTGLQGPRLLTNATKDNASKEQITETDKIKSEMTNTTIDVMGLMGTKRSLNYNIIETPYIGSLLIHRCPVSEKLTWRPTVCSLECYDLLNLLLRLLHPEARLQGKALGAERVTYLAEYVVKTLQADGIEPFTATWDETADQEEAPLDNTKAIDFDKVLRGFRDILKKDNKENMAVFEHKIKSVESAIGVTNDKIENVATTGTFLKRKQRLSGASMASAATTASDNSVSSNPFVSKLGASFFSPDDGPSLEEISARNRRTPFLDLLKSDLDDEEEDDDVEMNRAEQNEEALKMKAEMIEQQKKIETLTRQADAVNATLVAEREAIKYERSLLEAAKKHGQKDANEAEATHKALFEEEKNVILQKMLKTENKLFESMKRKTASKLVKFDPEYRLKDVPEHLMGNFNLIGVSEDTLGSISDNNLQMWCCSNSLQILETATGYLQEVMSFWKNFQKPGARMEAMIKTFGLRWNQPVCRERIIVVYAILHAKHATLVEGKRANHISATTKIPDADDDETRNTGSPIRAPRTSDLSQSTPPCGRTRSPRGPEKPRSSIDPTQTYPA